MPASPNGPRGTIADGDFQLKADGKIEVAEAQLIAVVSSELNARATEMIAELRRDGEAAEFGSASASFFKALDAGKTTTSGTGSAGSPATVVAAPQRKP